MNSICNFWSQGLQRFYPSVRRVGTGKSDCGISSACDFDVFQRQHITYNHITIRLRGYAGNHQEFFRERLDFAKSKGILKKQIVLDPEMVFSVVLQNPALRSSGEFQNCMNLICLCYPRLPENFFIPASMGAS